MWRFYAYNLWAKYRINYRVDFNKHIVIKSAKLAALYRLPVIRVNPYSIRLILIPFLLGYKYLLI